MSLETITHPEVAFSDARGSITNGVSGPVLRHAAVITSKTGAVRANHIHPAKIGDSTGDQYMWLLRGSYVSVACAAELSPEGHVTYTGQPEIRVVREKDVVYTPPLVAHAQWYTDYSVFLNLDGVTREHEGYGVRHTFPLQVKLIEGTCDADDAKADDGTCGGALGVYRIDGEGENRLYHRKCLRCGTEWRAL